MKLDADMFGAWSKIVGLGNFQSVNIVLKHLLLHCRVGIIDIKTKSIISCNISIIGIASHKAYDNRRIHFQSNISQTQFETFISK